MVAPADHKPAPRALTRSREREREKEKDGAITAGSVRKFFLLLVPDWVVPTSTDEKCPGVVVGFVLLTLGGLGEGEGEPKAVKLIFFFSGDSSTKQHSAISTGTHTHTRTHTATMGASQDRRWRTPPDLELFHSTSTMRRDHWKGGNHRPPPRPGATLREGHAR